MFRTIQSLMINSKYECDFGTLTKTDYTSDDGFVSFEMLAMFDEAIGKHYASEINGSELLQEMITFV